MSPDFINRAFRPAGIVGDAGERAIIEFVERTLDETSPEEQAAATEEAQATA